MGHFPSLKEVVLAERNARFLTSNRMYENVKSVSMSILEDVADFLSIPFSYCELIHSSTPVITNTKSTHMSCITLHRDNLQQLDALWAKESNRQRLTTEEQSILQKFQLYGEHIYISELIQFLKILIRKSTIPGRCNDKTELVFRDRSLLTLLAVDGFYGLSTHDMKHYILHLKWSLDPTESSEISRDCLHVRAVRDMYTHFDKREQLAGLTGTDSASIIFLVLMKTFLKQMKQGQIDDSIRIVLSQFYGDTERFLQRNAHYYQDIRAILSSENTEWMEELEEVYLQHFTGEEVLLNAIAFDKLNKLYQLGKKRISCNESANEDEEEKVPNKRKKRRADGKVKIVKQNIEEISPVKE